MDAEATAAGHLPADPKVWRVTVDGVEWGFCEDASYASIAQRNNPGVRIVTLRQAANALAVTQAPAVAAVLTHFPGATVTSIRQRSQLEEELSDEIPF